MAAIPETMRAAAIDRFGGAAALKLREGAFVAAEAYETEQLLHGYFAAIDESVRAFVLEGDGWAAERAQDLHGLEIPRKDARGLHARGKSFRAKGRAEVREIWRQN